MAVLDVSSWDKHSNHKLLATICNYTFGSQSVLIAPISAWHSYMTFGNDGRTDSKLLNFCCSQIGPC